MSWICLEIEPPHISNMFILIISWPRALFGFKFYLIFSMSIFVNSIVDSESGVFLSHYKWTYTTIICQCTLISKKVIKDVIFLTVCYYHVTHAFQNESTLCSFLNVKEILAQNRHDIWSLSDSNGIRTHNHLG